MNRSHNASNNVIDLRDEVRVDFEEVFRTRSLKELHDLLFKDDIWCSQINTLDDMVQDSQVKHNGRIVEFDHPTVGKVRTSGFATKFDGTPQMVRKSVLSLDEQHDEIIEQFSPTAGTKKD